MSDTKEPPSKPPVGKSDEPNPGALPRSVAIAFMAAYAQVGFAVLYAILSWPLANQLRDSILKSNHKAKKPKALCTTPKVKGCLDIDKTVHTVQIETGVGTALLAVVIVLLLRRIRNGTRSGRTFYIAASVIGALVGFAGSPLSLLAIASAGPVVPRIVSTAASVASIVAIVMLFRPASQAFFDVHSPRALGPRAGMGSLLKPRPPGERKSPPPSGIRSNAASRAEARIAKSKSRNDPEAIARDIETARQRAKSSKSRRTEY